MKDAFSNTYPICYSHLGLKRDNINKSFFYFSITVATAPIFGYLLQFWVDFKKHSVVLVNDFYLLRKLLLKMLCFYPTIWGKNETNLR